jgi:hypothetical protein
MGFARHRCVGLWLWGFSLSILSAAAQSTDWPARIREQVKQGSLDHAMAVAEEWIRAYPQDLDAMAWHARLLAWSQRWTEAEAEYRSLLLSLPADPDVLMDLAHLLTWQKRYGEALEVIERACALRPERSDCSVEQARLLRLMSGTPEESGRAPGELTDASRHEVRVGGNADSLSYSGRGGSAGVSLNSRWNDQWRSSEAVTRYSRYGQAATSFEGSATYRFTPNDALTAGAGTAGNQGIVPRVQGQLEYGHGFRLERGRAVRGIEATFAQRWMRYRDARVVSLSPAAILYLPKEWNWMFRLSMSRILLSGFEPNWKPAGLTRLTFPLRRSLTGQLVFATGTENLGTVDRLVWGSTRAAGGGVRIRIGAGQELITFLELRHFPGSQSQKSFGLAYAFRL